MGDNSTSIGGSGSSGASSSNNGASANSAAAENQEGNSSSDKDNFEDTLADVFYQIHKFGGQLGINIMDEEIKKMIDPNS